MPHARHDNLSPFKMHYFWSSSRQADNQLARKSLSHNADFGLSRQITFQKLYVINIYLSGPSLARHRNVAFRWRADDSPTWNTGLVAL